MTANYSVVWMAGIAILVLMSGISLLGRAAAALLRRRHSELMLPPADKKHEWVGTPVQSEIKGKSLLH